MFKKFIPVLAIVSSSFVFAGCLGKADSGSSGLVSLSGACGSAEMCFSYSGWSDAAEVADLCGGLTTSSSCSITNCVGVCSGSTPAGEGKGYYYSPTFNATSANTQCTSPSEGWPGGTFTASCD